MGLSCGNPTAIADLKPGEIVVDLGSGGGLDVFLAAQKVGPTGKAIGIDMTPEMLERARANARRQGLANVEFHEATIDHLPLPDASVDCVISNCVINLAPDKNAVLREIARVLEAGRQARDLRYRAQDAVAAQGWQRPPRLCRLHRRGCLDRGLRRGPQGCWVRCRRGHRRQEGLERLFRGRGASGLLCSPCVLSSSSGLSVIDESCCSRPGAESNPVHGGLTDLLKKYDLNDFAASVQVYAVKPTS